MMSDGGPRFQLGVPSGHASIIRDRNLLKKLGAPRRSRRTIRNCIRYFLRV
jgi:hypothetical protein